MNAPSPKWVRHWAGASTDKHQWCVGCGKLLVGPMSSGTEPRLRFFPRSAPVYERASGPRRELVTVIAAEDTFMWCGTVSVEAVPTKLEPHVGTCASQQQMAALARAVFRASWPKACTACGARGVVLTTDLESCSQVPQDCSYCLAQFTCPRCAEPLTCNPAPQPCSACGWSIGEPGEPPWPGCTCGAQARGGPHE